MIGLFGEAVKSPIYKKPVTAADRAAKIQAKVAERIARKTLKPFNPADFNLKSFPAEETTAQFIAQNVYIKPNYLVSMPEYCFFNRETGEVMKNPRLNTEAFIENQKNLLDNESKGKLSRKAVQGLRNSINWLCISAKKKFVYDKKKDKTFFFKVNFVTLTLPDTEKPIGSAELQKNLLNPFLTYMRKYYDLNNYVWRLEFQANGKLHVHLTTDSFLHLKAIRETWNRLLDENGYLKQFYAVHKHKNPNSTDVHATKKIKNMAAYLAKYMSKKNSVYEIAKGKRINRRLYFNDKPFACGPHASKNWYLNRLNFWNSPFNPRPIKGRIWSCSRELSRANKCMVQVMAQDCGEDLKCLMNRQIEYKPIMAKPKKTADSGPYGSTETMQTEKKIGEVYFLAAKDWFDKITGPIKEAFNTTRWMITRANENHVFEMG